MLFGLTLREAPNEKVELPMVGPYSVGGEEPSLKDLLDDPLIHMVARSDKIERDQLIGCVEKVRRRMRANRLC